MKPLLSIQNLSLNFDTPAGPNHVLENISLEIQRGEVLGLVGESGCGKSVMARAILRLLPSPPAHVSGQILLQKYEGQEPEDLLTVPLARMRSVRGGEISMIFQEPMTSLNPVFTVGKQMAEVIRLHKTVSRKEARDISIAMLKSVNMPDPERTFSKYPHELSGGMRQRVMIAMELSCNPALLIADEPTTALDVTVQGQVLALLNNLTRERGVSTLFITHDMGVVAALCDRVAVMYAGKIVELVPVLELFENPLHPYSRGLINAIPSIGHTRESLPSIPGSVPSLVSPPGGCRFHPRCPVHVRLCETIDPPMVEFTPNHFVACHCLGDECFMGEE